MSRSIGNAGTGKKTVLVVDDTEHVAELIREMLVGFGHEPEVCLTPQEALEKFAPGKFNLIITDYTMPRMNGIEFSREIRSRAPDQLILLITGSTGSHHADRGAPYNATLEKPFAFGEFQQVVESLLSSPRPVA